MSAYIHRIWKTPDKRTIHASHVGDYNLQPSGQTNDVGIHGSYSALELVPLLLLIHEYRCRTTACVLTATTTPITVLQSSANLSFQFCFMYRRGLK